MPAVAYELARPTPPALGTVVGSALGPGRIIKVQAHLACGGWMCGLELLTPVERNDRWPTPVTQIDTIVPEDGGA
jgi:hypothetical protein